MSSRHGREYLIAFRTTFYKLPLRSRPSIPCKRPSGWFVCASSDHRDRLLPHSNQRREGADLVSIRALTYSVSTPNGLTVTATARPLMRHPSAGTTIATGCRWQGRWRRHGLPYRAYARPSHRRPRAGGGVGGRGFLNTQAIMISHV